MRLQFWYSEDVKEWHWSFHTRHYAPNGQDYYQSRTSPTVSVLHGGYDVPTYTTYNALQRVLVRAQ